MFKQITIIGCGQIGGSLGLALQNNGYSVTAVDRDNEVLTQALRLGAAHRVTSDLAEGIKDAKLVVVATPVGSIPDTMQAIAPYLQPGVIVTDVGSVKSEIVALAGDLLPPEVDFVGGHPMAGSEHAGIRGANANLFAKAMYVLSPGKYCSPRSLESLSALVKQLGAVPIIMDAVRHDRAVGVVSHLPHLLAVALAHTAGNLEVLQPGSLELAAGSFRDGTRVVDSSPQMWQDIFIANADLLLDSLQEFRAHLHSLENAIRNANGTAIGDAFVRASKIRATAIVDKSLRLQEEVCEMFVALPDEPGALGKLSQALGTENINIDSIKSLPGSGTGMILGFRTSSVLDRARQIIQELGIGV